MAECKAEIRVKVIGAGGPKRLKVFAFIAKLFKINLKVEKIV